MISGTKRQAGLLLVLIGLLHTVVGSFIYSSQLRLIAGDGFWNTVNDMEWERGTAFWFMMFGFMLILAGYTADWLMKKQGVAPPAAFGWLLLAICLTGAVLMPASGFWLGLPPALFLLRK